MPQDELPPSPLPGIRCIEITPEYEAALQRFFEANPRYFMSVNGEPANAGDAHEEIYGAPPAGWPFTRKWLVGYLDQNAALVAMANIVSDLLARGVWHIGLFIVATSRHGSGDAHALYRSLEAWASSHGARWLRLGVVRGNQRAERFWERHGFVDTRTREGVVMGKRTNDLRVMIKCMSTGSLEEYRQLVPRDRPDAARLTLARTRRPMLSFLVDDGASVRLLRR